MVDLWWSYPKDEYVLKIVPVSRKSQTLYYYKSNINFSAKGLNFKFISNMRNFPQHSLNELYVCFEASE